MAEFDPYHKWLGIPPEEQPPNHYRLLGLTRFESDPDVIDSAAEGRMVLLRTRQSGPNADDSQRILNEVAFAQRCLLDPNQRAAYDQQLTALATTAATVAPAPGASGPPQTVPPRTVPPRSGADSPRPAAVPVAATAPALLPAQPVTLSSTAPTSPDLSGAPSIKRRRRPTKWFLSPALIGVLIAGLLLLGVIYLLTRSGDSSGETEQVAEGETTGGEQESNRDKPAQGETDADTHKPGVGETESQSGDGTEGAPQTQVEDAVGGDGSVSPPLEGPPVPDVNDAAGAEGTTVGQGSKPTSASDIELRSKIWTVAKGERVSSSLNDPINLEPDQSYFVTKDGNGSRTLIFETIVPDGDARWIRLEVLPDPRLPGTGPGWNADGNFVMSEARCLTMPSGDSQWRPRTLIRPTASFSQARMDPLGTLDGKPQSGWAIFPEIGRRHQLLYELQEPVSAGTPLRFEMVFAHRSKNGYTAWLGKFRISFSSAASQPPFITPPSAAILEPTTPEAPETKNEKSESEIPERLAIPAAEAIDAARVSVREAVPPPESQTPDALMEWSEQLLQVSGETTEPAELFALSSEAQRAATLGCDARLAFAATDILAGRFRVDPLSMRLESLTAIADRAQSADQLDSLLVASEGLALDLFFVERFEEAADLLDTAYAAFQRRDSDWHIDMSSEMRKFARRLVRARDLSDRAAKTLEIAADDGAANATLGMWHVVYNDDFATGLPFYRKGSDSVWKKLAEAEATATQATATQAGAKSLGDQWWDAGQRKDKETQAAMLRRAAYWYDQTIPKAPGIVKGQLKERVEKIRLMPTFTASKQRSRDIAVGESLDLLPLVDLRSDSLDGQWSRRHETIEPLTAPTATSRIRLPIKLNGNYTLAIEFTAVDGGGMILALPAKSRGFQVLVGANGMSGIQYVGGLPTPQNRIVTPARLTRVKRHSLLVRFTSDQTKGRIDIRLDKRPYLTWDGDLTKLDDPTMLRGAADGIALGAMTGSRIQYHSARLRLLSGAAERIRDAQPFRIKILEQ